MIIVTGGTKGGSGKSTIATNLAIIRVSQGKDVLLVDADDQETAADFTALRNESLPDGAGYTCIKLTGPSVRTEIKQLAKKYDDIFIDTGGRDTTSQRAALTVADILLVPFVPRTFDVWTLEKIAAVVDEMSAVNPNLKAYIFLNRADPAGQDNFEAEQYLKEAPNFGFLDVRIGTRKAFGNAQAKGLAITELYPKNYKAEKEILTLFSNVFNVDYISLVKQIEEHHGHSKETGIKLKA
ncbi:MAG: AAA family ATPase [Nitrospinales bacterium]